MNRVIIAVVVIVAMLFFFSTLPKSPGLHQTITPEEAHQRLRDEKGIVLLDVRTEVEYQEKHLPGSILLPLDELKEGFAEITQDKDAVIFVYCRSGNRSATAAEILVEMGYQRVYDLGGINAWKYETESGQ